MKASDNQATRARIEKAISEMHDAGCKMTISGVAKEAGVSNAAIHNRYPDLAVKIRDLVSRAAEQNSRRALIRKTGKFKTARQRRQALLDELDKI
jgi:AcrR family transcriptional regulator